jgi:HAD superfamily hydrolase (TIGR01509 family)
MRIKGAIFDMDGTIIDSLMFWDYLWKQIGEKYMGDAEFKPCDELNKKVRTMVYADAMAYFKDYYNIPGDTDAFVRFASSGVFEFYKDVAKAKRGADKLLASLKEQNIKLCLASATAMPEVKYALECHGLSEYFDFVVSCADIGVGKEHPDIYLKAKSLMGIPEGEICVFEDSYVALETAKKAGFQTVGIFDRYNFGQERLKKSSDIYLDENQTLDCLISMIGDQ